MPPDTPSQANKPGRIVLLTRPRRDSLDVARQLTAHGIETAIWPLTKVVFQPGAVQIPSDTQALVFTSRNGVDAIASADHSRDLTAWCVGDRTADAARAAGYTDVHSAGGGIGDLIDLLARQSPLRLFYPRARHVSADLSALLAGSGHSLTSAVVYDAVSSGPPSHEIAALLKSGAIGVVPLWSRRPARFLADQIAQNPDWMLDQTTAIAISARAAEPLRSSRFVNIIIAADPSGPSMISAIVAAVRQ